MYKYLFKSLSSPLLVANPKMELLDHTVILFKILRTFHTVFLCSFTILHSHRQCTRLPVLPQTHQLLFIYFFITIIQIDVKLLILFYGEWNMLQWLFSALTLGCYTLPLSFCTMTLDNRVLRAGRMAVLFTTVFNFWYNRWLIYAVWLEEHKKKMNEQTNASENLNRNNC